MYSANRARYRFPCPLLCLLALALCLPTSASAQIVSSATGDVELTLRAYFDNLPYPPYDPAPDQVQITPLGLFDTSVEIDGTGYYSAGGENRVDFNHLTMGPAQTWFTTHATTHSDDADSGGGGAADLYLQFYAQAPFYYRFAADVIGRSADSYRVSFNGITANAYYDHTGAYMGNFPLRYHNDDPTTYPIGWDTYVDEGLLPAGFYDMTIETLSTLNRYGDAGSTTGTATLLIQLQGDADLDGYVGLGDLAIVLNNWDTYVPVGMVQFGDLSRDGYVGLEDLSQLLNNWDNSVLPPSVLLIPEPTTSTMLGMISLLVLRRRLPHP